jgi:glycosyltransferase involved in cell wall biosynthesis
VTGSAHIRNEVAVVLPCFNAEGTVQRALDSVFRQTYQDFHIYAVDDGSTDQTMGVLQANAQRCSSISQAHAGPAAARNRAIRMSQSPFIAFLDADDEWLPTKLERQIAVLNDQPDVALICSHSFLGESLKETPRLLSMESPSAVRLFDSLVRNCFIATPTVVIRRACLDDVGLFRESLPVSEDFNLWLRIAARWRIACLREQLAIIHKRPLSLSGTVTDAERLSTGIAALEDVKASCGELSPSERHALRHALAQRFYFYGSFLLKTGDAHGSRSALASALRFRPSHWLAMAKFALSYLPLRWSRPLIGLKTKFRQRPQAGHERSDCGAW